MNVLNGSLNAIFDVLLVPLEAVGPEFSLFVVSGVFGILALIAFKHISWQRGIKATKDKIKGHMIEIRLYQDDLGLVSRAIGKVMLRNLQYLGLNFGPFVPLAVPFVFVVAQMVVRYGFVPMPVFDDPSALLAGEGTEVRIELAHGHEREVGDLRLVLPEGIEAVSKFVPVAAKGYAFQEIVATRAGEFDLLVELGGKAYVKKLYAAEESAAPPRRLQPERVSSLLGATLWPSEETLPGDSGLARVVLESYPESDLGWLPLSGPLGVIVWFVVFSMAVGFALLKPLGVQI